MISLDESLDAVSADQTKLLAALRRAVPVTRMVDYGIPLGDALEIHAMTAQADPPTWEEAIEPMVVRHAQVARDKAARGHQATAAHAWRAAYALLQCAQLAYNSDNPRKKELYEQSHLFMRSHAEARGDMVELQIDHEKGVLYGWEIRPKATPPNAAIVILGGLSGWGAVYLDMGRALTERGFQVILAEGPGQGRTRMRGGLHLGLDTLPLLGRFIDHACTASAQRIGVVGNSFGGLFAAHLAVRDPRVQAVCINGAPMTPTSPDFRTAREQMMAVFGVRTREGLAQRLADFALNPDFHRTEAAMLIVQGGRDALVPMESQRDFFGLGMPARQAVLEWADGEHTIYNHAEERNQQMADWFVDQLNPNST